MANLLLATANFEPCSVVDNMLDYQSKDCKIDPQFSAAFGMRLKT